MNEMVLTDLNDLKKIEGELFRNISSLEDNVYSLSPDFHARIRLKIKGEKFNSSLTPSVMKGIIELQKGVNHIYARVIYGDERHPLTQEEKKNIELVVQVEEGSSLLDIDWTEVIKEIVKKMSTKQLFAIAAAVGIGFLANNIASMKINSNTEKYIESQRLLQEQERTEQNKDILDAMVSIVEITQETQRQSMTQVSRSDFEMIEGESTLQYAEFKEEIKQSRPRVEVVSRVITDDFLIRAIHFDPDTDETFIDLANEKTGDLIPHVLIQSSILTDKENSIIENAEGRYSVRLQLIVDYKKEKIIKAKLDSIQQDEDIPDGEEV